MRFVLWLLLAVFAGPATVNSAIAASGTALAVKIDARAEQGANMRTLTVGADIFIGDRVVTDDNGLVQIRFSDDTELVVGPRSALVIDDYLLRSDGSAGKFAINALSGTFRFVTGNSPHDDYTIRTPTGTLAVRGTAFDMFVTETITRVLMYEGATILCNISNACVTLANSCEVGESGAGGSQTIGFAPDSTGDQREELRGDFIYADNQSGLRDDFRIDEVPACRLSGPARPVPVDIAAVMAVCDPVIAEQYSGDIESWGECGVAVAGFLASLGAPTPGNEGSVTDLVVALAELFKPGDNCASTPTELPDAIELVAHFMTDAEYKARIEEISATIKDCVVVRTAAIDVISPATR